MPETLPRTRYGTPKIRCTDDVLRYWAERIGQVNPQRENFDYSSMLCSGDSLYHYGRHFELARIMRDKRGRTRLVLLNGDRWGGGGFGPSTSSRQGDTRRAVAQTNAPSMVVPFSALQAAQIDFDTVRPIHVRDDRFTIEEHSSRKRPANLTSMASGEMRTEKYLGYNEAREWGECEREVPVYVPDPNRTISFVAQHGWSEGARLRDGVWHWEVKRHWLGDAIFRARTTERRTRRATADELAQHAAHLKWTAEAERLRLEERQLRHEGWAVDERYGFKGDYRRMTRCMFAAQGFHDAAEQTNRASNEHERERVYSNGVRNGRMPIIVTRWATFLSSFDYQERSPLYFLCELPHGVKPNTVDEAVQALKPPEVVAAEARGLKVIRQGDLFAIPTKLTKRQLQRLRGREDFTKRLRVLGTNHSVTEGVVCKGGAVLGRGIMRHEPDGWRAPDHARQKLGDGKVWYLLVRNTVPQSR
ncbi:MAG: hypothetical protein ACJ780_10275 [Solirubrobacteraceae bacterium]|jgi:hypothetical protein